MYEKNAKQPFKNVFLSFFRRVIENEEVQTLIYKNVKRPADIRSYFNAGDIQNRPLPYADIGKFPPSQQPSQRDDVIIITARFRSGSTLLWNLFRHMDGMTSYYEPFNERQWFNKSLRGNHTDRTHKNVSDYSYEYDNLEILQQYYQIDWIDKNLLMDASFWAPDMKRFVEIMIEKAPGRPVLQFNRIDFRLPWFRHNFPRAKIVHLYRHPREQWCSSLMEPELFPKTATMGAFPPYDKFYLCRWARDLQYHFPFLDERTIEHPYQMFYYIWKLSYMVGVEYSDYSLAYENILSSMEKYLIELFHVLNIKDYDMPMLKSLLVSPTPEQWKRYAEDEWFSHHENVCETALADFLKR